MAADLRAVSRAGAALLAVVLAQSCAQAEDPCATATAKAVLSKKGEPGDPLRVRGVVYRPDGTTPAAGVILYAYQTDWKGRYIHIPTSRTPRIKGWMRTDAQGRFEFLTIRPGPYPDRTEAAHIHFQLWGPDKGVPTQWNVDLLFEDDKFIKASQRAESESLGKFAFIKAPVKGPDGVFETTLDIRLKPEGDVFEDMILHGVKPCGVNPPSRD
jgi:protocatechuate 3,4-dioxygenase beta subunit